MLKTERSASGMAATDKRPERIAWLIMFTAFALFCTLVWFGSSLAYSWLTRPEAGVLSVEVEQPLAVQVQRYPSVKLELLQDGELHPFDRVQVSDGATPGPATILRFGSATVALWADTDVQIGHFGRQWNDRSAATARLRLDRGQILAELADDDQRIEIEIGLGGHPVVLESPGRYRVRILADDSPTTALVERVDAPGLEVTTERGRALVGEIDVRPGQRLVETGDPQQPQERKRNRWELLRDGTFQQLVDSVFKPPLAEPLAWNGSVKAEAEEAADSGLVLPTQACSEPITRTDCEVPYVRLVRKGGNTKGFSTAIEQRIDTDVSSYARVRLQADVKIVYQSLSKAGGAGTECPLLIRVMYQDHTGDNLQRDYCFWAFEYADQNGVISNQSHIITRPLAPDIWQTLDIDLKQELKNLAKIQNISFQANGHDYESHVRNARLTAEGLTEISTP